MGRFLYIFNAFYPVNPGETFLANEIEYFRGFDKIFIFPLFADDGKKKFDYKSSIQKNIEIVRIGEYSNKNKIESILKAGVQRELYREYLALIKSQRANWHNIKKATKFVAHCIFFADVICKHVEKNIKSDDDVILYSYWMNHDAYVASIVKNRMNNKPFMLTRGHRVDIYEYADENYIPMRNAIIDKSDLLCPISDDGKKYLMDSYNVSENKILVQRLGTVDHGTNISVKGNVFQIVSCSWMRKVKRLDMLIDALSMADFPIEWTHYGDGEEFEYITKKANELKSDYVNFRFMGSTPNEKVLEALKTQHFDAFINVSSSEGIPVSIMEAMSFGKPIIATDVGGSREIVYNGVNGYLLRADCDATEIFGAIKNLYSLDDGNYEQMAKESRATWEKLCCGEKNYKTFCRILEVK
ncbi:glycosyltransferase [Butyrivibrio fibrisolvens]|uniref:glycosyltransferase n=1 Tax=Butyrivibrio fibrisolvens TaxID=831 RepID=UPI0004149B3F|nr:glycosyltransferase [Butyrivibrio fibrisolvens]